MSRCNCAIAFAFSNGIGSSNQPGRKGCSASSSSTAVRGDRNSLHSMKISPSGPGAFARRLHQRARPCGSRRPRCRAGPRSENGRHLKAVKPRRTASRAPSKRLLRRVGALQPVARVAAQRRADTGRRAAGRRARPAACPRDPTARCRAPPARSGTPRRRASARRDTAGASGAPGPAGSCPIEVRRDIRGSRSRPTRSRRAASLRPSPAGPRRSSMRTNSQLHQSTQYLNVSMRVIFMRTRGGAGRWIETFQKWYDTRV